MVVDGTRGTGVMRTGAWKIGGRTGGTIGMGITTGGATAGTGAAAGYTLHTFTASTVHDFSVTASLGGVISGSGTLTADAAGGELSLAGANTYTGSTTSAGGTVQVGAGGTTGSLGTDTGAITVNSGGTLAYNRSDAVAVANLIAGAGGLARSWVRSAVSAVAISPSAPRPIHAARQPAVVEAIQPMAIAETAIAEPSIAGTSSADATMPTPVPP